MRGRPRRPAIEVPAAQQQFRQPMSTAHQIDARIITRADHIADGLRLFAGGLDLVSKSARSNWTSLRASRASVLMRSPGFSGINDGAITWH